MQGLNQPKTAHSRIGSHVTKLMLGGAVGCLLATPAGATGFVSGDTWSGPWVSAGIGAAAMSTDTKADARREDQVDAEIGCTEGVDNCDFNGPFGEFGIVGEDSAPEIQASLNFLQQQLLEMDGLSDINVFGTLALGYDLRLPGSNFVLGAFAGIDFYDVEADFKAQGWSKTQTTFELIQVDSVEFQEEEPEEVDVVIGGALFSAALANGVGDGHVEIDGKIEQDYSYHVGGRLGYIFGENLMTYFGAAWTRTHLDGYADVSISDPVCVNNNCQNSLTPSPTQIRVNLDEDVDGYKLLAGGEYALGYNWGGNWFLRGEASFSSYDGITKAFSNQKKQFFEFEGSNDSDAEIELERVINESVSASLDKEDLAVHAALVYKLGGAPAPVPFK